MPAAQIDWTPDTIQRLRAFWAEGLSTAAIGARMGASKNAIVGKVHRLNLPARPSPIVRHGPRPLKPRAVGKRPTLPPLGRESVETKPEAPSTAQAISVLVAGGIVAQAAVAMLNRPRRDGTGCSWPIGEPGHPGFHFCREPAAAGRPYCEEHCSRAYVRKTQRRRDLTGDADAMGLAPAHCTGLVRADRRL